MSLNTAAYVHGHLVSENNSVSDETATATATTTTAAAAAAAAAAAEATAPPTTAEATTTTETTETTPTSSAKAEGVVYESSGADEKEAFEEAEDSGASDVNGSDSFNLASLLAASTVSFDKNGNLVVQGGPPKTAAESGSPGPVDDAGTSDDSDGDLEDSPRTQQPLLGADPDQMPAHHTDSIGHGTKDGTQRSQSSRIPPLSHYGNRSQQRSEMRSTTYDPNDFFPMVKDGAPSLCWVVLPLVLFAVATVGFFACAVIATDVADPPSCRDSDWSTIEPYLVANTLDLRDCTEMVHVLSCEYALRLDTSESPPSNTNTNTDDIVEKVPHFGVPPMRQVLNLCGGSCQVCGVTWLGKQDVGVGRWCLYIAALVAPLMGLAWSRVYLSHRNRADVLQLAQYLPGPLFACLALLLVALGGGVVGHASAAVLLVNAVVSFSSVSSDRFQAACRAGELLEATMGTWLGQALAMVFGAAASVFFIGWASVFVSVLARPVDSASAAMIAGLFFYAYWASYVIMAIYIMTVSGATVALVSAKGGAYEGRRKFQIVLAFFRRAIHPRQLGAACLWAFVGGSGMLLWTTVTGLRSVCGVDENTRVVVSGRSRVHHGGCVRQMSLFGLPVILFSHRALLVHVALEGSSVGAARDKTVGLLAYALRHEDDDNANQDSKNRNSRASTRGTRAQRIATSNVVLAVNIDADERLRILDADYSEYAPLIGPGISAAFSATLVCGVCLLFYVDAAGATLLLLGAFAATHATTTISLLGVSTVMDAVRMVYLMRPEELQRSYPVLHHRLMRLHFMKRQQKFQLQQELQLRQQQDLANGSESVSSNM